MKHLVIVCLILVSLCFDYHAGQTQAFTCPGALPARLKRGDVGQVIDTGNPNNLRDRAATAGKLLKQLQAGDTFNVIDDPVCADKHVWYRVQSGKFVGWTAESGGGKYWLESSYSTGPCVDDTGLRLAYIPPGGTRIEIYHVESTTTCSYRYLAGQEFDAKALTWAPDGGKLAFHGYVPIVPGGHPLYNLDLRTTEVRKLTAPGNGTDNYPVWSPNGKWLVFHAWRSESRNPGLWILEGQVEKQISHFEKALFYGQFAWAPDSSHLAFVKNMDDNWKVFVVKADGTGELQLSDQEVGTNNRPTWSPDSQWIAYESTDKAIVLIRPDGSGRQILTTGQTPAWSPDGREIIFTRNHEMLIIDVQSHTERRLLAADGNVLDPSWSPDGRFIAYLLIAEDETQLHLMQRDGTGDRLISHGLNDTDWNWLNYAWSPRP
jgi:Tol biopolymer transport system component